MSTTEKETKLKIAASVISAAGGAASYFLPGGIIKILLCGAAFLLVGFPVIKEASEQLFHGEFLGEDFLMSIASVGAFAVGEYEEAIFVMVLYTVGELFEDFSSDKSKKSIDRLINQMPNTAVVIRGGAETTVSPEEVEVGETVVVMPGGKVPVDGILLTEECRIDLSYLNGESVPRKYSVGDTVLSGSINCSTAIRIKAVRPADKSAAARILELTVSSAEKKAKPERFITAFSKYYTPAVVIIAVLFAVIPLFFGKSFSKALYDALIFLVISCPCALVISVPMAYFGGLGAASRHKILIKGSEHLETLSRVKNVLLDKTGTVTKGNFEVSDIFPAAVPKEKLLDLAATAEWHSTHPVAAAIKNQGRILGDAECEEIPGKGVKAVFGGDTVYVGNKSLMDSVGVEIGGVIPGATTVYVAAGGVYAGAIAISDTLKDGVENLPSLLRECGVKTVSLLSGDKKETAEDIGRKIGADISLGGMLPEDKVNYLTEVKKSGVTAFVGDGINDTPVIAAADVSATMGKLGSDSAIEFADAVLLDDDPLKLVAAIKIAKKTHKIAVFNIAFALTVKFSMLLLSFMGLTDMWAASFADVGVLIIAVLNSMRLLKLTIKL